MPNVSSRQCRDETSSFLISNGAYISSPPGPVRLCQRESVCVAVCCSIFSVLQCVKMCCSALQCVVVGRSVWQYIAVCCSGLQCVAVGCSVLQ